MQAASFSRFSGSLRNFFASPAGRAVRYALSALLLVGFIASVDWTHLARLRGQVSFAPVLLAAVFAGIAYPLHAWRWWLLLRAQGLPLSLHWAHVATWIGNFYNAFLVGGLGGDAARAFYVCRDAPGQRAGGLLATLLDRVMGLVILLGLAALGLVLQFDALARHPEFRSILVACAAVLAGAGLGLAVLVRRPPEALARWLGPERTRKLGDLLAGAAADRRALALALGASIAIWLFDFISVWLLARGVGLPLPFDDVCLAMSVAYAATVLPVSVGGHGVREGAMLGVLALLGLLPGDDARQRALLLALLVWALTVLWSLVGGLVLLFARRWRPTAAA